MLYALAVVAGLAMWVAFPPYGWGWTAVLGVVLFAGVPAEATEVIQDVDVCDDLYGVAKGLPENRLIRETKPRSELAADIRREIASLDEFEVSTALTRGGNATVLMLCGRRPGVDNTVDLDIIGTRLLNTRLGTTAAHYLDELRAETVVMAFSFCPTPSPHPQPLSPNKFGREGSRST